MKIKHLFFCGAILASFTLSAAGAQTEMKEDVKEAAADVKKDTRQAVNNMKDKGCELVNGKMQCFGKKMKHKAQNLKEEVKDKLDQ